MNIDDNKFTTGDGYPFWKQKDGSYIDSPDIKKGYDMKFNNKHEVQTEIDKGNISVTWGIAFENPKMWLAYLKHTKRNNNRKLL